MSQREPSSNGSRDVQRWQSETHRSRSAGDPSTTSTTSCRRTPSRGERDVSADILAALRRYWAPRPSRRRRTRASTTFPRRATPRQGRGPCPLPRRRLGPPLVRLTRGARPPGPSRPDPPSVPGETRPRGVTNPWWARPSSVHAARGGGSGRGGRRGWGRERCRRSPGVIGPSCSARPSPAPLMLRIVRDASVANHARLLLFP